MRVTRRQREQKRVEDAERLRRLREGATVTSFASPCERHPQWRVDLSDRRIPPPAAACPLCVQEQLEKRDDRREKRVLESAGTPVTPRQYELLLLHEERNPSSTVVPGSPEEQDALDRISELREEEQARDFLRQRRGATLVSARAQGGRWVEIYAVPGRGFVEVAP